MKRLIVAALIGLCLFPVTARAEDLTTEASRIFVEGQDAPRLMDTTAYCEGSITYSGKPVKEYYAAGRLEWLGYTAAVYEAVPDGAGGYEIGELISFYELSDIGYGKDSGDGVQSKVRKDKASRGTIERGECIDIYRMNLSRCYDWMRLTGGKVYVQLIPGKG